MSRARKPFLDDRQATEASRAVKRDYYGSLVCFYMDVQQATGQDDGAPGLPE